ncbi:hypothetical protein K491DRAFT_252676 [Lophiostoma macrostomum CBS 122681]|uniref:F-box domain-containing protein n=1 Tax=Lophiostoma macrostomum CBS 122681 TaxID=1314788 RepID=A0A6A6TI91_9PLEO|nr:hypothetical protein K491DRAFT_252676 [Lophiostoma macrostomum CBS 122681]
MPSMKNKMSCMRSSPKGLPLATNIRHGFLELPAELLQAICDYLRLDEQASIALTCHHLYSIVGSSVWKEMNAKPQSPRSITGVACLLRKLQRDRQDRSIYVCYGCQRFHKLADATDPHFDGTATKLYILTPKTPNARSFPYCDSAYMNALREIYARLELPRDRQPEPTWCTAPIWSLLPIINTSLTVSSGVGKQDVFMRRTFSLSLTDMFDSGHRMYYPPFLQDMNLQICPHICFGRDYAEGDGSINDLLRKYYSMNNNRNHEVDDELWIKGPPSGCLCQECYIEVEVRFKSNEMQIRAYQFVGPLKTRFEKLDPSNPIYRLRKILPRIPHGFSALLHQQERLREGQLREAWDKLPKEAVGNPPDPSTLEW